MFNLDQALIKYIVAHRLNHGENAGLMLSDELIEDISDYDKKLLFRYFMTGIMSQNEVFKFTFSNLDHTLNPIYQLCKSLFIDESALVDISRSIAKHLFHNSSHPNIKSGDLSIVIFDSVLYEDEMLRAIGIFKSETTDEFLQFNREEKSYKISSTTGLALNKLDKGCLIFETNHDDGFILKILDQSSSQKEAVYWKDSFLNCTQVDDAYFNTMSYMNLTQTYLSHQLKEEFQVEKADQIDLLNKSAQYFKENDSFKEEEFVDQLFVDDRVKQSFQKYKSDYQEDLEIKVSDDFSISNKAVKKSVKHFKSVLKLDKNFHIYIHGNRELIEKGYDQDKGMKYYKVYYENED